MPDFLACCWLANSLCWLASSLCWICFSNGESNRGNLDWDLECKKYLRIATQHWTLLRPQGWRPWRQRKEGWLVGRLPLTCTLSTDRGCQLSADSGESTVESPWTVRFRIAWNLLKLISSRKICATHHLEWYVDSSITDSKFWSWFIRSGKETILKGGRCWRVFSALGCHDDMIIDNEGWYSFIKYEVGMENTL